MSKVSMNTRSLEALVCMTYLSEPHITTGIHSVEWNGAACVKLKPQARLLLREKGPREFHEMYGSHFVTGYTRGASPRLCRLRRCSWCKSGLMHIQLKGIVTAAARTQSSFVTLTPTREPFKACKPTCVPATCSTR